MSSLKNHLKRMSKTGIVEELHPIDNTHLDHFLQLTQILNSYSIQDLQEISLHYRMEVKHKDRKKAKLLLIIIYS
jgi:hypothetical protein